MCLFSLNTYRGYFQVTNNQHHNARTRTPPPTRHIDPVTLEELRAAADKLMLHGKVGAYSLLKPILEHFE